MDRRFVVAVAAVAVLATSAGCLTYITGGGEISNETLDADPAEPYTWDSEYDARIDLRGDGTYLAVYNVSERGSIRLQTETGYGTEEPLDFRAFRYQYPNGTVITGSEFRARGGEIERTPDEVGVRFADEMDGGKIALAGDGTARRFVLPTYVEGSYEVLLPEGFTTDFWLFGHVSPRGYEIDAVDGRERITWTEVTAGSVLVQAYRERDFWIFVAIAIVATGVGVVGLAYFRRQLRELREQRTEMGLDVEEDSDDDPPPGRRR